MLAQRRPAKTIPPPAAAGLNYRHLYYFLTVARRGSMRAAAQELGVYQATVSVQIAAFERALGEALFDRTGRPWRLTEAGRLVRGYAEEIFGLGQELLHALRGTGDRPAPPLSVGIDTGLSRRLAARLLAALVRPGSGPPAHLLCRSGPVAALLGDLGRADLDLLLTVGPPSLAGQPRLGAHRLGEYGLAFLAPAALADSLTGRFPCCLNRVPTWLPAPGSPRRVALDRWFAAQRVRPQPCGQCDDEALLEPLAAGSAGILIVPTTLEGDLCRPGGLRLLGRAEAVREAVYAVLPCRRRSPVLAALQLAARPLFAPLPAAAV